MNHNQEVDRVLDQALREYADAEPLAGMEERILRRIAASPAERSRRMGWIWALAAAAVILVAVWLSMRNQQRPQHAASSAPSMQQSIDNSARIEKRIAPSAQTPTRAEAASKRRRPAVTSESESAAIQKAKPSSAQFPAPVPLTREENALLALARSHPDELLKTPVSSDQLSIAPIEIKPLAPENTAIQGEPE